MSSILLCSLSALVILVPLPSPPRYGVAFICGFIETVLQSGTKYLYINVATHHGRRNFKDTNS
jgi:hypothetical protein